MALQSTHTPMNTSIKIPFTSVFVSLLVGGLALFTALSTAPAQIIYFETDFQDYPTGNLIGNKTWGGASGNGTVTVQNNIISSGNNAAVTYFDNSSPGPYASHSFSTNITTDFLFSVDMGYNGTKGSSTPASSFRIVQPDRTGSGIFLGIRSFSSNSNFYLAYADKDYPSTYQTIGGALDPDKFYTVKGSVDFGNATYSVSLWDGGTHLASKSGITFREGANKDLPVTNLNRVYLVQDQRGADARFYFDNISIIPEPVAAWMLIGSASLLVLRRRRRPHTKA